MWPSGAGYGLSERVYELWDALLGLVPGVGRSYRSPASRSPVGAALRLFVLGAFNVAQALGLGIAFWNEVYDDETGPVVDEWSITELDEQGMDGTCVARHHPGSVTAVAVLFRADGLTHHHIVGTASCTDGYWDVRRRSSWLAADDDPYEKGLVISVAIVLVPEAVCAERCDRRRREGDDVETLSEPMVTDAATIGGR